MWEYVSGVIGLLRSTPCCTEITVIYNTVSNFISVWFWTAYYCYFRARNTVRVSFRVGVNVRVHVRDR